MDCFVGSRVLGDLAVWCEKAGSVRGMGQRVDSLARLGDMGVCFAAETGSVYVHRWGDRLRDTACDENIISWQEGHYYAV